MTGRAELAQRRSDILAILEERAYGTTELARLLGVSPTATTNLLNYLRFEGRVEMFGQKRASWRLAPDVSKPLEAAPSTRVDLPTASAVTSEPEEVSGGTPASTPLQADRVLEALVAGGPSTSAEVANRTGLSLRTCSAVLNQLAMRGRVVQKGTKSNGPRGGRPLLLYVCTPFRPAPDATWSERSCEGCGKPVKWRGHKHPRCPDCQLKAGRDRFSTRLAQRRDRHAEEADRLKRIDSPAKAERRLEIELAAERATSQVASKLASTLVGAAPKPAPKDPELEPFWSGQKDDISLTSYVGGSSLAVGNRE